LLRARQSFSLWRACRVHSEVNKRLNLRTVWRPARRVRVRASVPENFFRVVLRRTQNESRVRHYDVNALSQVCFSCPIRTASFSLGRMAQGFLRCCGVVTGKSSRRKISCALAKGRASGACRRGRDTDSIVYFVWNGAAERKRRPSGRRRIRNTTDPAYLPSFATLFASRETLRFAALR
jgi:hypothetical protein